MNPGHAAPAFSSSTTSATLGQDQRVTPQHEASSQYDGQFLFISHWAFSSLSFLEMI